jgi:hypothetical protein
MVMAAMASTKRALALGVACSAARLSLSSRSSTRPEKPAALRAFCTVASWPGSGMWMALSALKPSVVPSRETTASVPTRRASFRPSPISVWVREPEEGLAPPEVTNPKPFCNRSLWARTDADPIRMIAPRAVRARNVGRRVRFSMTSPLVVSVPGKCPVRGRVDERPRQNS